MYLTSLLFASLVFTAEGLRSWGNHVCTRYKSTTYTSYYSSYYSCGWLGWSSCYSKNSERKYRSTSEYYCCSGWHQVNSWDSGCDAADCGYSRYGQCANGGTCTSPNVCSCPSGNFDSKCNDILECQTNNGGCEETCIETLGSYYCLCPDGKALTSDGKSCDYQCHGEPVGVCKNGGTCMGVDRCHCAGNYVGEDCSDYNECAENNGGCSDYCTNNPGSFECSCTSGYTLGSDRLNCQDTNECNTGNGGCDHTCVNSQGSYSCRCNTGYVLDSDDRTCNDVNECNSGNGGCTHTCTNSIGSFSCSCQPGYTLSGRSCNDINECSSSNGGCAHTCTNTDGSFRCSCNTGYKLDSNGKTCSDINECSSSNGGCAHTCTNTDGSFRCSCNTGYKLDTNGKTCSDINECSTNKGNCDHNCINTAGSFRCSCNTGYELHAFYKSSCIDLDECLSNNGGCDHTCSNSDGSFTCGCNSGYQLSSDGNTCADVNECSSSNGGCAHTCTNTDGSFRCSCNTGYKLDSNGKTCSDINECSSSNGGCAHTCTNTDGSFRCSCNTGYKLDSNGKTCSDVNECVENTDGCGQICTNTGGSFRCSCTTGYSLQADKKLCSDINECITGNDCQQTCNNNAGSYKCSCISGYALQQNGRSCLDINECSKNTDGCGQVCINTGGSFKCDCLTGYTIQGDGKSCSDDNECNIGTDGCGQNCKNTPGSFVCSCNTGYRLDSDNKQCSDINECATDKGGCSQICINTAGSFRCDCNTGYSLSIDGTSCNDVNECKIAGICDQNCQNSAGSYSCSCDPGYNTPDNGRTCNDIDECATNTDGCDHNCHNTVGSFTCSCRSGYTISDTGIKCFDVNECLENNGGCDQNCINTAGSRTCTCRTGYYTDDQGITCKDENECLSNNGGCAQNCQNLAGSHQCSCNNGYRTSDAGITCEEIDECVEGSSGCDHICTNSPGSFTCSCNSGWYILGDQRTCQDVNECQSSNGGCSQVCNNVDGGFSCSCESGYSLKSDKTTCTDIDECETNNGQCDHVCHNTNGDYFCSCRSGYQLESDGKVCSDIDECSNSNGGCDQTCTNSGGSFKCSCLVGYLLEADGLTCADINECSSANGDCSQTCTNSDGSFLCSCLTGYDSPDGGKTCNDIDECGTNNGGCQQNCHNSGGSFACSCNSGYSTIDAGLTCADIDECATSNGGCAQTCVNSLSTFSCSCLTGYRPRDDAKFCDDIDECSVNNGGCSQTCTNSIGSFGCSCITGYQSNDGGVNCFDISECDASNGGCEQTCSNTAGGFSCSCNAGFNSPDNGVSCDDVDECSTNNGGCEHNCENRAGSFLCSCNHGYNAREQAKYCDDIDECTSDNGGCSQTCTNNPGSFDCSCLQGFNSDDNGKICYDIDECGILNGNCGQNCHNTEGSYSCSCNTGYSTTDNGITCTDIDECSTTNGGCSQNCENSAGYFTCSCDSGFSTPNNGITCNNINECDTNNGGCSQTCLDSDGSFSCECLEGYDSPDNQVTCFDIDECLTANGGCSHNCHNTAGSSYCTCRDGYSSPDNQVTCNDIDECGSNNGGCSQNCLNSPGSYSCSCDEGFDSPDNQVTCNDIDECDDNNGGCSHNCFNTVPGFYCTCRPGFSTPDQNVSCYDIDECADNNGGCDQICHNTNGSSYCTCRPGYDTQDSGLTCTDINECVTNNGGCSQTCTNTAGEFYCSCLPGYETPDDGVTCTDMKECDTDNGGCPHNCTNSEGSYSCSCLHGYSTPNQGKSCYDIDECASDVSVCEQNCQNSAGSYQCSCRPGYETFDDGATCPDIDECDTNNGGCQQNCHNTKGSFSCSCENGFVTPDGGVSCTDIDECAVNNGDCQQTCENLQGSYSCHCLEGYRPSNNAKTCTDILECDTENGGCSHTCTNSEGSFTCTCDMGYYLLPDERICQDTDECDDNNGDCQQVCNNAPGNFSCACFTGYLLQEDLQSCLDIDECSFSNGGCNHNCSNSEGSFTCSCDEGYFLQGDQKTCLDIDECAENNGGCLHYCNNTVSSYFCTCQDAYHLLDDNKTCQDNDECAVDLGGCEEKCINLPGTFACSCNEGRDFNKDGLCKPVCYDYTPGECGEGGSCRSPGQCDCKHGFEPEKCLDINECLPNGEANCSEICVNIPGSFYCACSQGFYLPDGHTCVDVDECEGGDICSHTCVNTVGSFHCECPLGYKLILASFTCEFCALEDMGCWPECDQQGTECVCPESFSLHTDGIHCIATCPCQHGGICLTSYPDFECNCTGTGYTGEVCQVDTLDIPELVFVHVGYGPKVVEVKALSDKVLVLITSTSDELLVQPSEIYIPPNSGGKNFTLETQLMGLYRVDLTLTGAGAKLFEYPPFMNVLAGDVFIRLKLQNKQFPIGCFPISLSIPSNKGEEVTYQFISTSPWYRLGTTELIFFTLGVPTTIHNITIPISSRGVEITTSDQKLRIGPVSSKRNEFDGTIIDQSPPVDCRETILSSADRQDLSESRSDVQTLLQEIASFLPDEFELKIKRNPEYGLTDYYHGKVLTGTEVLSLRECLSVPVFPDTIYHVFVFSADSVSLFVLGEELLLPQTQFCVVVDMVSDDGKTVMVTFSEPIRVNSVGLFVILQSHLNINITISGLAFSSSSRLSAPLPKISSFHEFIQRPNCSTWALVNVETGNSIPLQMSTATDVFFYSSLGDLQTHVLVDEGAFGMKPHYPFSVHLQAELHDVPTSVMVFSSSQNPEVLVTVGKYGCGYKGSEITVLFESSRTEAVTLWPLEIGAGSIFSVQLEGVYHSGLLFAYSDIEPFIEQIKVLVHNLESVVDDGDYLLDNTVKRLLTSIQDTLFGLEHDALTLLAGEEGSNADEYANILVVMNSAAKFLRSLLNDLEDHLYLTLQQPLQERLGFVSFFHSKLVLELNKLTDKLHEVTVSGLSRSGRWGVEGAMSLFLNDLHIYMEGNMTYSETGQCCPGEHLCDNSGRGLELQLTASVLQQPIAKSGLWTKYIWQYLTVKPGTLLKFGLAKTQGGMRAVFNDGMILNLFDMETDSSLNIKDGDLTVEGTGQIYNSFPAKISLHGLGFNEIEEWSLAVYVQLLPGNGSFQQQMQEALNSKTLENIFRINRRVAYVQENIRTADNKLTKLGQILNSTKSDFFDKTADVVNIASRLNQTIDMRNDARVSLNSRFKSRMGQVDSLCTTDQCRDNCTVSPRMALCQKQQGSHTITYPCIKWESCSYNTANFSCHISNLVCSTVRKFLVDNTNGFGSNEFKQKWMDYNQLDKDASALTLKLFTTVMEAKIAEATLDRTQEDYDIAKLVKEQREAELSKVAEKKETLTFIEDFIDTYGEDLLFQVKSCSFGQELKGIHETMFEVQCKVNSMQTGWVWYTSLIDFVVSKLSIQETATRVYDRFLETLNGLQESTRNRRKRDTSSDILQILQQTISNNSVNSVTRTNGAEEWNNTCIEYTNLIDYIRTPITILKFVVSQYISEVISGNEKVGQSLSTVSVNKSLYLHEGNINDAVYNGDYGVSRQVIIDLLASVDPSKDPVIGQLINMSRVLNSLNIDVITAITHYDLLALWITQMDNFTSQVFVSTSCSAFQDCVQWAFDRQATLLSKLDSNISAEALEKNKELQLLYNALVKNQAVSVQHVSTIVDNITNLLSYDTVKDYMCGTAPVFVNETSRNVSVVMGSKVTIGCYATGNPRPKFTWWKIGEPKPVQLESDNPMLQLDNVQAVNEAQYYCVARNHIAMKTSSIYNILVGIPPTINNPLPKSLDLLVGDTVQLTCDVSGKPSPQISWQTSSNVDVSQAGAGYRHSAVHLGHAGLYKCLAVNDFGRAESTETFLQVTQAMAMCPEIQTKLGYIRQATDVISPIANNGLIGIEQTLGDYFVAALTLIVQNSAGNIAIQGLDILTADHSLLFIVTVHDCDTPQTCTRITCEQIYTERLRIIEDALNTLLSHTHNDTYLFSKDGFAYSLNPALAEIQSDIQTCRSGDNLAGFTCAKFDKAVYLNPPINLQIVRGEVTQLTWEVSDQQLPFIKGYNVVLERNGGDVFLNRTTNQSELSIVDDILDSEYRAMVQAYSSSYSSDWAQTTIALSSTDKEESSYLWIVGLVVGFFGLLLIILYVAYRFKKSLVRPSREPSTASMTTGTSVSRTGSIKSYELPQSRMKQWSVPQGVTGSESASKECIQGEFIPHQTADQEEWMPVDREEGPQDIMPEDITLTTASMDLSN